jgi:hypothetical protein
VFLLFVLALVASPTPRLTSVEAGALTRTVVSYLIPPDRPVGPHPTAGRTIVFDRARAIRAFAPLVGRVEPHDILPTLPALLRSRKEAVTCDRSAQHCTIVQDAIFLSIDTVDTRDVRPGEYRVVATLLYTAKAGRRPSPLDGGEYVLRVGLIGGKWKHWSVLHAERRAAG